MLAREHRTKPRRRRRRTLTPMRQPSSRENAIGWIVVRWRHPRGIAIDATRNSNSLLAVCMSEYTPITEPIGIHIYTLTHIRIYTHK